MDFAFYQGLAEAALAGHAPDTETCRRILSDPALELLPLLNAAYAVRTHFCGKSVQVHILNNAQNGRCPEDCAYCAQARTSEADIEAYPIKDDAEILEEARRAHEAGAHRYCMVFAGRGPNQKRTDKLASLIRQIKSLYNIEVCVSAGLLDQDKAQQLKDAGLDRMNHNLNTSRSNYAKICTTHTYEDRLSTLRAAKDVGLETCSGLIVGMGETQDELIEIANTLREIGSASIPVNFLLPIEGNKLTESPVQLTPEYCLRVLCLFRFTNPSAEVRCAAGREYHLRSMQVMCLYPANSIFLDGYLNGRGDARRRTYRMIRDAGFTIESDTPLEDLLGEIDADSPPAETEPEGLELTVNGKASLKRAAELRPAQLS
jgi:biotin synthase